MKDVNKSRISEILSRFVDETALHGCRHVRDSQRPRGVRFVWAAIVMLMFAALGFSLTKLWIEYASYPYRTVWKLSREASLALPEITVCLRGEFDMDKVKSWKDASDYMKNRWIDWIAETDMKRLIFVQVQPSSLDVTTVEHVPELTLLDIFAQLGGFMGLFMGASLMTWLEMIDVAMLVGWTIISAAFRRLCGRP
ncbi:FMRFamide-activated amiloride-sensitive sodium channel [Elysia marginata]|uniref:FMRFamide-activated amiloride-sensitive sodium channel n=1 Tax=Elysia marginata TaxID=1093978 RepID=A0AAV4F217_9GAST|nr:FMRFamide-activated amiloride-sensitive sodium channel [Elysia marginata]